MNKFIATLTLIIGLFSFIQTSNAEMSVSEDEKAVFAYFKLTEQEPDFTKWIMTSDKYQEARTAQKRNILEVETSRLQWGYDAYDVTKDFITIKRPIRLTTTVNKNGKRIVNTRFDDDRHNETPYFPIPYGKESIAFIVEGLENYKTITLQPEQIEKIKQYFYNSTPYEASLEVRIRPKSGDAKNKLFVDYRDQWLMLGDIAYLKLEYYDDFKLEEITVWDYNAPWYTDEAQKKLLDFFKQDTK